MITVEQHFGTKPHTPEQEAAARDLLDRVDLMCSALGITPQVDPDTGTQISGSKGGSGDGGFRLEGATTGGEHSSHKIIWSQREDGSWYRDPVGAKAGVDVFDPDEELDAAIDDDTLKRFDLYREHPASTKGWCHLTTRRPHSGKRTFRP